MKAARTGIARSSLGRSAVAGVVAAIAWSPIAAYAAGVNPATVNRTLAPGGHLTLTKTVTTPAIPPKVDVYFLADTTGSMGSAIANVRTNAASILASVDAASTDPRYGAGNYLDFQSPKQLDPYAFNNGASIPATDDGGTAALAAISAWSVGNGHDTPEANLYALHRVLADADFRTDSTRVIVQFGDAPGHDPVCAAISGETSDVTEASVTAELVAAHVRVISVSTDTGGGLNADPTIGANDYQAACGAPGGTAGQATRIAAATGGVAFEDVPPNEVSDAILAGLSNLPVTVTPVATCDKGLTATFDAASRTVTSGTDAVFKETLTLATDVTPGNKTCTVDFRLNGTSGGSAFVQRATISHLTVVPATLPITGQSGRVLGGLIGTAVVLILAGLVLLLRFRNTRAHR